MGRPKAEVCPQGHAYEDDNVYVPPSRDTIRICLRCKREQGRVASKTYREKLRRAAEIRTMFLASQPRERDGEGRIVLRGDTNDVEVEFDPEPE